MSASDEHRLVALRLRGLAGSDRRWILSRLADLDRIKLEGYLEELKGFQLDPETLAELEQRMGAASDGRDHGSASKTMSQALEQLLSFEPLWLSHAVHPDPSDHRIGDAPVMTQRARAAAEAACKHKASSWCEKPAVVNVRPRQGEGLTASTASVLTRLREAWRL